MTGDDPFSALGLPARADLSDDEVRAAWRRIAAATHPDRPDGGDAARFASAAAAYADLRTSAGRGEAHADLTAGLTTPAAAGRPAADATAATYATDDATATGRMDGIAATADNTASLAARVRAGRPGVLTLRVLLTATVSWACVAVAGWQPATLAITIGALTWLARTARLDLAPPLIRT